METEQIVSLVLSFAQQHPNVAAFLAIMSVCRIVFKPLMVAVHAIVDATPSVRDNEILAAVEANKFYRGFAWLLDYAFSVKLIK